jgi:DNA-binding Lrp family transcriptional regulator
MPKSPSERDQALLRLLQENAREAVSSLARKLGVSRTAVQERINRMVRDGIIEGFTVRIGSEWSAGRITAIVSLVVDPKHSPDVIRALEKLPAVVSLWTVSGRNDLVAMARAASTAEIDQFLDEVGSLGGVTRTESSIILSTKFDRR